MSISCTRPFYLISLVFIYSACAPHQKVSKGSNESNGVTSTELFHIPYSSPGPLKDPILVMVLHGDAPFNNPSYQYHVAKKIAEENSNVVAVGMLRPGYKDNEGNRSEGERGKTTGDNYTRDVLAAINNLAAELKEQYNPSKIILVGHSGGAAISANLLAEYPHFYAGAVLVACPCDLHEWRAHMKALRPRARIWNKEVNSLSPIEEVERMDDSAQIIVLHGDNDEVVPIDIAKSYVAELEANNKQVNLILLENQGHEIAFDQQVLEAVKRLIE